MDHFLLTSHSLINKLNTASKQIGLKMKKPKSNTQRPANILLEETVLENMDNYVYQRQKILTKKGKISEEINTQAYSSMVRTPRRQSSGHQLLVNIQVLK